MSELNLTFDFYGSYDVIEKVGEFPIPRVGEKVYLDVPYRVTEVAHDYPPDTELDMLRVWVRIMPTGNSEPVRSWMFDLIKNNQNGGSRTGVKIEEIIGEMVKYGLDQEIAEAAYQTLYDKGRIYSPTPDYVRIVG